MIVTGLLGPRGVFSTSSAAVSSPPMVNHATFNLVQLLKYLALAVRCAAVIRRLTRYLMLSRREAIGTLLVLFTCSLPAVTARLYSSDEVEYFSYLRSLWFDHDVSFENEYRISTITTSASRRDFHDTFLELTTPASGRRDQLRDDGRAPSCGRRFMPPRRRSSRHAGGGPRRRGGWLFAPYVSAVAYGSAFYGFCAIVLSVRRRGRIVGKRALSSGLIVWVGTPLLFYSYIAPPFSHACSAFAVALFVTLWLHVRRSWPVGGAVALGFAAAIMAMVREQDIFFVLGVLADFSVTLVSSRRRRRHETACPCRHRRRSGVRRRVRAAAVRLSGAQRQPRTVAARRPQDVLVCTARVAGARRSRAWLLLLDAARGARRRGGDCDDCGAAPLECSDAAGRRRRLEPGEAARDIRRIRDPCC